MHAVADNALLHKPPGFGCCESFPPEICVAAAEKESFNRMGLFCHFFLGLFFCCEEGHSLLVHCPLVCHDQSLSDQGRGGRNLMGSNLTKLGGERKRGRKGDRRREEEGKRLDPNKESQTRLGLTHSTGLFD
jgi:hypothetical protein